MPIIKAQNLTKKLTGEVPVTLVNNISLSIEPGEFAVIVGPSGSGKSSLLYLLGLLDTPSTGQLWIGGEETTHYNEDKLADMRLEQLGFVFQFHFLLPEFTALENVTLPMRRLQRDSETTMKKKAADILERLGLKEQMHKLPKQLSGGQQQRVSIARALANNPPIILADEPTGNLDTASSNTVQGILKDLAHQEHHTVIAVTHDLHFAEQADHIFTLVDGKLQ